MRYTQYCGLTQATYQVRPKLAAMNLKKLALCKWAYHFRPFSCSSLMLKSRVLYARIRLFRQALVCRPYRRAHQEERFYQVTPRLGRTSRSIMSLGS